MIRLSRRTTIIIHDIVMVAIAWEFAWLSRFNFYFGDVDWTINLRTLPLVLLAQGVVLWPLGLYRGIWRFASLPDLWGILRAAVLGALCTALVLFIALRLEGVPRSVLILYPLYLVFALGGPRLGYRMWKDHSVGLRALTAGKRVLVVGAGRAGEALVRDMLRNPQYLPVGFADDRAGLHGRLIHGMPVLGSVDRLPELAEDAEADLIVIAIPSATSAQMRRIVGHCERTGRVFRTLPHLNDVVQGNVSVRALREVSIDDLLGREKVQLDWHIVHAGVSGKVVLISGGGGSIGSELCNQVAQLAPDSLIIFERGEYNLYRIEADLRRRFPTLRLTAVLGDVTDAPAVARVMETHRPQVVFHAAAFKHVPMLQYQAREAVRNNVLGTWTLAQAAMHQHCEKFVLISTDKAVNPTSVMGASKRIAEIVCAALNGRDGTRFVTVRFGNVLGSAGSVVPLFQEQIRAGGPITVTHPEMTRFFMTIPEACQLILQAGSMGQGGEIFVLDMGEPVRITYLAEQLIRLSGREPGRDIRIEFTGIRPGERLHEELFYADEPLDETSHAKIHLARHRVHDRKNVEQVIAALAEACLQYDEQRIATLMRDFIPGDVTGPTRNATIIPLSKGTP